MSSVFPRRLATAVLAQKAEPFDPDTLERASLIVNDVRAGGEGALLRQAERLGDLRSGEPHWIERPELERALARITPGDRDLLERCAARIATFADLQRSALVEFQSALPGGFAIQRIAPVERAACYAPGGRHPLPSSVLMTAVTARRAGVREVIVASPRPADVTLAAAAIAGADALLAVGGAQAIAALAFGAGRVPACDVIVGPGNRWVAAAKKLVAGEVAIDSIAGPSELVVVCDEFADPALVAADLLAQAEHDIDARAIAISTSERMLESVGAELERQLGDLPTATVARCGLANGGGVLARDLDEVVALCNRIAPEHLQLSLRDYHGVRRRFEHFGALFTGRAAAEVLGDYGAGPNHVLPTGATARFSGGLSVLNFLRVRTELELDDSAWTREVALDAARLARLEGLEAHARAAERRT